MSRRDVVLIALPLAVGLAGCSSSKPAPLTADEWRWCQYHWRDGLYASQSNDFRDVWYFNHMGMPNDPDTIRVCRASAKP